MRSPTAAVLWEIWRPNRAAVAVIGALTAISWVVDLWEGGGNSRPKGGPGPLNELLALFAFLLLFGIFRYTESNRDKGLGRFPRRLFTLPVSSLRLVAVPVLSGIGAVEVLYVMWRERLAAGGPTSPIFVGVLLAAFMMCYQAALWSLAHRGALRLLVIGAVALLLFWIGFLPSFPSRGPSPWGSEAVLGAIVAAVALGVFVLTWWDVARLRSGGGRVASELDALMARVADTLPRRDREFSSSSAAQFWFEWRCSGMPLPAFVAALLLLVFLPFSWFARHDPANTVILLGSALAMPIVLAVPVGMAFSKPTSTFWSDELAVPAFMAVRPLDAEDVLVTKQRVAGASVGISWLLVLAFLGVWLPLWANLETVSRVATQLWVLHGHSAYAVYGIVVLVVAAAAFLTWRFLVTGLWIGLSGNRGLFTGSVVLLGLIIIGCVVFNADRFPGWVLEDPERMVPIGWAVALAVVAKYWFAARAWRACTPRFLRRYLLVWLVGTVCFVVLALLLWRVMRLYLPMDTHRFQSVLILIALLIVPLGRVGAAPAFFAANRHHA